MFGTTTIDRLAKGAEEQIRVLVRQELESSGEGVLKDLREAGKLREKIKRLKAESADLDIKQKEKDAEWDRRETAIDHKIGLEKTRQTQELELAKRDAVLSTQEENLKLDRKRFEDQMEFHKEQLEGQITYLKDMISDLAERLPSASFIMEAGTK